MLHFHVRNVATVVNFNKLHCHLATEGAAYFKKKKPKCRPNCGHVNRPQVLVFKLHHPIVPALQTPPAPLMIST